MTMTGSQRATSEPKYVRRQLMPCLYGLIMGLMIGYQLLPRNGGFTDFTSITVKNGFNCDCHSSEQEKGGDKLASVVPSSYRLAYDQSLGFFDDIPDTQWKELYQRRARNATHHLYRKKPLRDWQQPAMFYLKNYEPTFTCPHARRVGGVGDGPKWTCDPHRLARIAAERQSAAVAAAALAQAPTCLVYSVGSAGRYQWEDGLRKEFGNICEIHVFDPKNFRREGMAEQNMFFHTWGLKSSDDASYKPKVAGKYLSLQETLQVLGHQNRTIDIFKIDCEGCEWFTYRDWMTATDIRQILVETHGLPAPVAGSDNWPHPPMNATDYFDAFAEHGFVLFSKEVNIHPAAHNQCVEWAYIKLHPDFLHGR
jgi:hypothetical protein